MMMNKIIKNPIGIRFDTGKPIVMEKNRVRTGPEELRIIVSNINVCRESFNEQFTAEQLLQIYRMLWKSKWDILPDEWSKRQIKEALKGIVPDWDDNLKPIYKGKNNVYGAGVKRKGKANSGIESKNRRS